MTSNESAERLIDWLRDWMGQANAKAAEGWTPHNIVNAAWVAARQAIPDIRKEERAAERRATVGRIRAALDADFYYGNPKTVRGRLNAILDEEAAR